MNRFLLVLLICMCSFLFPHTEFLQKNIYSKEKIYSIPKIIHQIWVGDAEIPQMYLDFMETWKAFHPDWEYKLWTDDDIESFPWKNKREFDGANNPGMKSDIWRYEIVYNYGGVYVDADMECKRSLNLLHERLDFYAGNEDPRWSCVGNNFFAAKAKSIYLQVVCEKITLNIEKIMGFSKLYEDVLSITGPKFFNNALKCQKKFSKDPRCVILPFQYFQPVLACHHGIPVSKKEKDYVENSCFCIHYNGCSWCKNFN
jgi:mannosyltransferase OCH1-like enzyme